jgi:hypothetical protein
MVLPKSPQRGSSVANEMMSGQSDRIRRSWAADASPSAEVRASIDVQHLSGHLIGLREIEHRFGNVLGRCDLTKG